MMDRRGFLKSLVAGIVTAATVDPSHLLSLPGVPQFLPAKEMVGRFRPNLSWMAYEFARQLERQAPDMVSVPWSGVGYRLGARVPEKGDVLLAHHLNIGLISDTEILREADVDAVVDRVIKPAAYAMAHSLQDRGVNVLAPLPHPPGRSAVVTSTRVSVAAIEQFDILRYRSYIRFDVLGGRRA